MRHNLPLKERLKALKADIGFIKSCLAEAYVLPFDPFSHLIKRSGSREGMKEASNRRNKLWESLRKRMYRRRREQGGDWKRKWKEDLKQLKALRKAEYVQTPHGFEPRIRNPFGNPPPEIRDPITESLISGIQSRGNQEHAPNQ